MGRYFLCKKGIGESKVSVVADVGVQVVVGELVCGSL